jgi:hypothetical protein
MFVKSNLLKMVLFRRAILVLCLMVLGASTAASQSAIGDLENLQFEIINATTGQPGTVERFVMQYSSTRLEPLFDIQPSGSTFGVPDVPLQDSGRYILTIWSRNVPYYYEMRGRTLKDGPILLHVFDTSSSLNGVSISGLDLLIRKTETLLELDYMMQVQNSAHPQVTVVGEPPLMILLPEEATTATLTFGNGPNPQELKLNISGGKAVLAAPITSGKNQMRLKTTLKWSEGMEIPVGANVPVESWGLMATPANLDIQAFDLERSDTGGTQDNIQLRGPAVAADEVFVFRMASTLGAGTEEDLFTKQTDELAEPAAESSESDDEKDNNFPFVVLAPIFVVILAAIARKRRRS